MKKQKEILTEKKESFKDKLLKFVNNRCTKKPFRNKPVMQKYNNDGSPVGNIQHVMGVGKNYAVMYFPKRKKLKGWMK